MDGKSNSSRHGGWQSRRHRNREKVKGLVDQLLCRCAHPDQLRESKSKATEGYQGHEANENKSVSIELELRRLRVEHIPHQRALGRDEACSSDKSISCLPCYLPRLDDLRTSVQCGLRCALMLRLVEFLYGLHRIFNHRHRLPSQHAFINNTGARQEYRVTRHQAIVRHLHNITRDKFVAGNRIASRGTIHLVASSYRYLAFVLCQLPYRVDVSRRLIQVFCNTTSRDEQDAHRVLLIAIPEPESHRKDLKDVEGVQHLLYQERRQTLLGYCQLASAVPLLQAR